MNDKTYNGWTNYATWRVNLEVFDGMNIRDHFDPTDYRTLDLYEVSEFAKDYAHEFTNIAFGDGPVDIACGWARAFLAEVDWRMIASHLIENASEVDA